MDAQTWFNASSFHQHKPKPAHNPGHLYGLKVWSAWDKDTRSWRYWEQDEAGNVYETDEIGRRISTND